VDLNGFADGYPDAHPDAHGDQYLHGDQYKDLDGHADAHEHVDGDDQSDLHAHRDQHPYGHRHVHSAGYPDLYVHPNHDLYAHFHSDGDNNVHGDSNHHFGSPERGYFEDGIVGVGVDGGCGDVHDHGERDGDGVQREGIGLAAGAFDVRVDGSGAGGWNGDVHGAVVADVELAFPCAWDLHIDLCGAGGQHGAGRDGADEQREAAVRGDLDVEDGVGGREVEDAIHGEGRGVQRGWGADQGDMGEADVEQGDGIRPDVDGDREPERPGDADGGRGAAGGVGRDEPKRGPDGEWELLREGGQRGRVRCGDERVADGGGEPSAGEDTSERVQRGWGSGEAHHGAGG